MPDLAPTLSLLHAAEIPQLGLGTSPMNDDQTERAVDTALELGYRLIDTAENYRNEVGVGRAIASSGLGRDELFVTTKFNRRWHSVEGPAQALDASLERLQLDAVDLLLIHWPNPSQDRYVDAWRGIVELHGAGRLRAIGVSNFKPAHLQRLIDETGVVPDLNQIQLSPETTRADARAFHAEHGIATESWSPLGSRAGLLAAPAVESAAAAHDRTGTQVVLRWHVQHGLVVIPKSAHTEHLADNLAVFDFELSADEMAALDAIDQGEDAATDSDAFGH